MGAMRRFGRLQVALAIGGLGLGLACGSDESGGGAGGKGPIRVGHFASLTGDTATFGQSTDRGIRMAVEEINAKGGALGRPLEVISEDDRSITEEARTAAQKLLQRDQVVALLGEVASSRSLAAAPEAQRARVPDDLARLDQPEGDRGRRLRLPHLLHRPLPGRGDGALRRRTSSRRKRVAILFDFKQDYSVGLADFFRKTFTELGGEIVADERYTSGDIEFRAQLTTIRAAKPGRGLRARLLHRARPDREAGARARPRRAAARRRRLGLGEDARDRRHRPSRATTSRTTTRPTPTARRCRASSQRYKAKHGEVPDAMAALGYDTAGILADALDPRRHHRAARSCATRSPRRRTTTA